MGKTRIAGVYSLDPFAGREVGQRAMKFRRIVRQQVAAEEILEALRATGMKIPKRATLHPGTHLDKEGKVPLFVQWESKK